MVAHIAHQLLHCRREPVAILIGDVVVDDRHVEEAANIALIVGILNQDRLIATDVQVAHVEQLVLEAQRLLHRRGGLAQLNHLDLIERQLLGLRTRKCPQPCVPGKTELRRSLPTALTSAIAEMSCGRSGGAIDCNISICTSEISGRLARSKFFLKDRRRSAEDDQFSLHIFTYPEQMVIDEDARVYANGQDEGHAHTDPIATRRRVKCVEQHPDTRQTSSYGHPFGYDKEHVDDNGRTDGCVCRFLSLSCYCFFILVYHSFFPLLEGSIVSCAAAPWR